MGLQSGEEDFDGALVQARGRSKVSAAPDLEVPLSGDRLMVVSNR